MTGGSKLVAAALVCGLALVPATEADGGYIELVKPSAALPPVAPALSVLKGNVALGMRLVVTAGPMYNKSQVSNKVSESMADRFREGFALAAQQGQKAVLLRVEVYQQTTDGGTYYSVRNGAENAGVTIVGVGATAGGIKLVQASAGTYGPAPESGKSLVPGASGYFFARREGNQVRMERYSIHDMDQWSAMSLSNQEIVESLLQREASAALNDYIDTLANSVKRSSDAGTVNSLIKSRNEAVKAIVEIETKLEKALARARRAQATSESLQFWTNVVGIASALASANASMGEGSDLKTSEGNSPATTAELKTAVETALSNYRDRVNELKAQRQQQQATQQKTELQLRSIGDKYNLDSRGIPAVRSTPP